MIKKELSFTAFDSYGEEREHTETVRFLYSLPAIKMYEQRTVVTSLMITKKHLQHIHNLLLQLV
ncbi:hypothetical protein [Streptococcus pyogenes]|uniref:hypothetical protein n=1 Tax=Streptococcus pyogenes TaxID=1314 RepID=UPI001F5DBA2D|nr:hypothetical protein [Streptococcus pyogenes]